MTAKFLTRRCIARPLWDSCRASC